MAPWEEGEDGNQVYVMAEEEKDLNWCWTHEALWPACEGEGE